MELIKRKYSSYFNFNNKTFYLFILLYIYSNLIKADGILPFNDETKQQHGQKKQKSFIDAMWEIENDPSLKSLKKAKKQSNKNVEVSDENIDVDTEEIVNENSESPPQSSATNNEEGEIEIETKSNNGESGDKNQNDELIENIEAEKTKRVITFFLLHLYIFSYNS